MWHMRCQFSPTNRNKVFGVNLGGAMMTERKGREPSMGGSQGTPEEARKSSRPELSNRSRDEASGDDPAAGDEPAADPGSKSPNA